jgi:type VI protein secretion system component VasK
MRDISRQVEHLTQELRKLRLQLEQTHLQPRSHGEYSRVLNQVLGPRLVPDLTELVNQLTHFLWQYIDSAARPPRDADFALQSERLEQATDMLRRLHFASSPQHAEPPVAFVARMTETVDRLLESAPKPDIPAVAGKASGHGLVTIRLERTA